MKLQGEIDNEPREIEIRREGERVFADIDGRAYELEVSEPETNVYLFKHDNRVRQIYVAPRRAADEPFAVRSGGRDFEVKVFDPKRLRGGAGAAGNAAGTAEIKTAMPGKVVRVLTEAGAQVAAGDGILIVEAMKMQNEMKAPKDGTVKEIRVAEGATVNAGDVLAVIE